MAATGVPFYIPAVASNGTLASTFKVNGWVPTSAGAPTATRRTFWTDAELTTPATNPATLGASGRVFYVSPALSYAFTITDAAGAVTYDTVFIPAELDTGGAAVLTPLIVSNNAALTALTADTGLVDNGVYQTLGRSSENDGGQGQWLYDSASTATANGGTILAIDGGGAGRFVRLYTKGRVDVSWFGLTQGSTSGSVPADNVTAITAAMAQCNTDGGGEVILPPTGTSYIAINSVLDNTYSNVLVKGAGRGFNHDVGANVARGGTRIRATAAITMARHRTVSGSASTPREDAGGFVDITFDSGGSATRILHVTSRYDGIYRFYFVNCEGTEAVLFDSLVTSSTLGEAADNQNFELDVVGRLIDSAASDACIGVVFDGASNANSSISAKRISIDIVHTNGDAVWFKNADNLLVNMLRSISVGTGRPFLVSGTRASNATYTDALHIDLYTGTNASYVEGTDTGGVTTAGRIIIDRLDDANGTPLPTGGTGAVIVRRNSKGNAAGYGFERLVAGEAQASVIAGKAAISASNSLYIYNTSESHSLLSDGTNIWRIRIASGNLEFSRAAGSGKLNLPADTLILINTAQLSLGAADSGGAGFKLLRVPN
jgi:hypothetical protein